MSKQGIRLPCLIGGGSPITDDDKPIIIRMEFLFMTVTAEKNSILLLISLLRELQEIDEMLDFSETLNIQSSDSVQMISNGLSRRMSLDNEIGVLKESLGYPSYISVSESQLNARLSCLL